MISDETERRLKSLVQFYCKGAKWASPIPGVTLFRSDRPFGPVRSLYDPRLCIVLDGRKRISIEETVIEIGPGDCLAVVLDLPVSAGVIEASPARPHLSLTIDLHGDDIAGVIADVPALKALSGDAGRGVATAPADQDLLEPVERLLRLLDRPADISMLAPLLRREILYRLMQGRFAPMLSDFVSGGSRLGRISTVTAHIRQNFDRPMVIAELAAMAKMSPTSFHRAFKAATLMSPVQFRTWLRLHEARRRLLIGEGHIGRVAIDVGYHSQSQFNREYRRMFGEAPGAERHGGGRAALNGDDGSDHDSGRRARETGTRLAPTGRP